MVFTNKSLKFTVALLIAFMPLFGFANDTIIAPPAQKQAVVVTTETPAKPVDESEKIKEEIKEVINHHILDSHDFNLLTDSTTGQHYGFPLPVILWDNGLHVFSSSKFNHGESVAEIDGAYYKLYHEKVFKTDKEGTINLAKKKPDSELFPTNAQPIDLSITKGVLSIILVALLLFFLFAGLAKSYHKNGGISSGAGRFFEPVVLYVRDEIAIPNIGEKHYKKYMSFLLTVFFFIWFLNMFGLTPLGINVTGNIAVTFGLAIITFLITNLTANKNYWKHIFWMPGVPLPMKIILAPIELLGVFIKPFSLMIRLFANMFAGHIVLMSLIGLMFIFKSWLGSSLSFMLSFIISIIEILVALLQAYIFTILSALYFGSAVVEEHADDEH